MCFRHSSSSLFFCPRRVVWIQYQHREHHLLRSIRRCNREISENVKTTKIPWKLFSSFARMSHATTWTNHATATTTTNQVLPFATDVNCCWCHDDLMHVQCIGWEAAANNRRENAFRRTWNMFECALCVINEWKILFVRLCMRKTERKSRWRRQFSLQPTMKHQNDDKSVQKVISDVEATTT